MITRFEVQNYKALRDVALDLSPVHLLIGPNDSGKTSVLEAIAALCRSANPNRSVGSEFGGAWKGRQLVWREEPNLSIKFSVNITDALGTLRYVLACTFDEAGHYVRFTEEFVKLTDLTELRRFPTSGQPFSSLARLDELANSLPAEDLATARRVQGALTGVHFYRWNPKFLALPAAQMATEQFQMEYSGFGLPLVLDDILGYDRKRFTELEDRFRKIFPEFKSIKLVRQRGYRAAADAHELVPSLQNIEGAKGLEFELSNGRGTIPASQVSDGVLLVLAYVTVLYLPKAPRVILVEEPENGIHPKRLEDVLSVLRDLVSNSSGSQLIMTTHSPYVVDLFKPEEVSLCQRGQDGAVSIHRLSNSKTVREQLDVFSLGEIWTAEGEDTIVRSEGSKAGAGK